MENNVRLIDANAMRNDWLENGENEYVYDTNAMLDSIDAQPTIDPETLRPVGEWTAVDASYWSWRPDGAHVRTRKKYRHNECGKVVYKKENFCPNCGAKMKGVEDRGE